jgi:DNA-binding beta-propeller fold protein YncE
MMSPRLRVSSRRLPVLALAAVLGISACSDGDDGTGPAPARPFLTGTSADPGIALSVSSSRNALLMLQTGSPSTRVEIPLGASSTVTPVDFSVRAARAAIPLGNAASVAIVDLTGARIERFFTFPSGNATGSAWLDDSTVIVCNQTNDYCGRIRTGRTANTIPDTVRVTDFPTGVLVVAGRIFVISSNLDDNFSPIGNGVVTELSAESNRVVRTFTVGPNPQYAAASPDGTRIFVTNSGNFGANNGSLSVINLSTNTAESPITGFGDFPGPIEIDSRGRAFISGFSLGTVVWDINTRAFLRGPANSVCARRVNASGVSVCRGATGAAVASNGDLYQAFFGSSSQSLPSYLFVYDGSTFALKDSVSMPLGTNGVRLQTFPR